MTIYILLLILLASLIVNFFSLKLIGEQQSQLEKKELENFMSNINNDMHNISSDEYELVKKNTRILQ